VGVFWKRNLSKQAHNPIRLAVFPAHIYYRCCLWSLSTVLLVDWAQHFYFDETSVKAEKLTV
jgi:hypothetical protein